MKLGLLPPLVFLCSDLLLRSPTLISALPFPSDPALLQPDCSSPISVSQMIVDEDFLFTSINSSAQETVSRRPSNVIFHRSTGLCVLRKLQSDPLKLGPCNQSDSWTYTPQKFLVVKGTYLCLQAVESGKPANLGIVCFESDSSWDISTDMSDAKKRISTELPDGSALCLDVDPSNTLMTNPCLSLSGGDSNLDSQWFEFARRNEVLQAAEVSPLARDMKPSSP